MTNPVIGVMPLDDVIDGKGEMRKAAQHLAKTERGREAMRVLLDWWDRGTGLGLDAVNQDCVLTLITAAWGPLPGSARDAMRDALENE